MEQLYVLVREKTKEKQQGSHRVAAEIVAGMICGSKYWTLEMVSEIYVFNLHDDSLVIISKIISFLLSQCFLFS